MAKNLKTTEAAVVESSSPSLVDQVQEAARSAPAMAGMDKPKSQSAAALAAKLRGKAKVEFAGGSLPNLEFSAVGDAFLLTYRGKKTVKGDDGDFDVLNFDVLDADALPEIKVKGMGSIPMSATMEEGLAKVGVGDHLLLTFHGKGTAKKGRSAPNLFSVDRVEV